MPPFGHGGAKGVKNDETAHKEGEETDKIKKLLANLYGANDFRAAAHGPQAEVLVQDALQFPLYSLLAGSIICHEVGLYDINAPWHIQQALGLGKGYQDLLVARDGSRRQ